MNNRHNEIIKLLASSSFISVTKLSQIFEVSEMTIRRDLTQLEKDNQVKRVFGGVVSKDLSTVEPSYNDREQKAREEKNYIANLASDFVIDNTIIGVDCGSTCLELVRHLMNRKLTIVTNSLRIMNLCMESETLNLIIPPGTLRKSEGSIIGSKTVKFFDEIHLDQSFIGVGGVDIDFGCSDYSLEDVEVKKAMINCSDEILVLADKLKLGKKTCSRICKLEDVDILITNKDLEEEYQNKLITAGVKFIYSKEKGN